MSTTSIVSVIEKRHVSAQELLEQSYTLARQILESGFAPTFMCGIWRGGAPVGIAVQEFLKRHGVRPDHIAIRTSSYTGIGEQSATIHVHGLEYLVEHANATDRLLLIDDIYDSGRSVQAVLATLRSRMRANMPQDVRVATVFYKPANNKTSLVPHYFLESTSAWIVFPHELESLSLEEIRATKGERIAALLKV